MASSTPCFEFAETWNTRDVGASGYFHDWGLETVTSLVGTQLQTRCVGGEQGMNSLPPAHPVWQCGSNRLVSDLSHPGHVRPLRGGLR